MLSISIDDKASPYLDAVAKNFPNELDSSLRQLVHNARNLYTLQQVAFWHGTLRESITAGGENLHYWIKAEAPYAKIVEGPTKPHFASFYKNPNLRWWAEEHGLNIGKRQKGMTVYKSGYPAMGGGQYMFKTSLWIGRNLYSYIDRAIMKSLRK